MSNNRFSIYPIQYPRAWDAYKVQMRAFWTADELDFSTDMDDWEHKLTDNERFFIKNVLAFFSQSDGIVNENLAARFYKEIEIPEIRAFYTAQMLIETIHSEVYGLLIESYIKDSTERNRLFNAIDTIPAVKKKAQWALKWIESDRPLAIRQLAFAIVEGVFFSGSFCSIFWLRKRGLMKGLASANDLIARDEGLHWEFASIVYESMNLSVSESEYKEIMTEAVAIEQEFITESLPVALIGMNSDLMKQYIEYTADRVGRIFGFSPIYNTQNPFDFMTLIDMEVKKNFFETRVTEYQKSGSKKLEFDAAF